MDFFSKYLELVSQSLVGRRIESLQKAPDGNRWSLGLDNGETLVVIGDRKDEKPVVLRVKSKEGGLPETWRVLEEWTE